MGANLQHRRDFSKKPGKANKLAWLLNWFFVVLLLASFQNCTPGFQDLSGAGSSPLSALAPTSFARSLMNPVISSVNNVYSPTFIVQDGTLVMYFGGWLTGDQINDKIYRSECHNGVGTCDPPALVLDSVKLGFQALNDPTIVTMPGGYYLMFMTGLELGCFVTKCNHTYYATSYDGITWSNPQMIVSNLWVPAAAIDGNGHVILYGNPTQDGSNDGQVSRYDLGTSGIGLVSSTALNLPKPYANIDVQYRPSLGVFQMLAEVFQPTMNNQIDYLVSTDGIHFVLVGDGIIKPQAANGYVRTPAASPTDESFIAYGETTDPGAEANQIYMVQLAPLATAVVQATPPPVQATPPPVCVASGSDQNYLTTAVRFFNGASGTSEAAQAADCNAHLEAALSALQAQNWPCDATATTIQYVSTCVKLVMGQ